MINPRAEPKDQDIVAARIGAEATVKVYTHRGGNVVLEPANPAEREIVITPGTDFAVLGVVCGVFRPSFDSKLGSASIPS
jgi:repressor LexA